MVFCVCTLLVLLASLSSLSVGSRGHCMLCHGIRAVDGIAMYVPEFDTMCRDRGKGSLIP